MNVDSSLLKRQLVNVNEADVEALRDDVVGIGQVLAERIVAYREEHGAFASLAELEQVSGIGPSLLARIADQITVGEPSEEAGAAQLAEPSLVSEPTADEEMTASPQNLAEEPRMLSPEVQEPVDEPEPMEEPVAEGPSGTAPAQKRSPDRSGLWPNVLLVMLGGVAGVVLTLLIAVIWAGTVDFAPRREVNALSQNMDTMQANQDLAWARLGQLTLRADDLERDMERLQSSNQALIEKTGVIEGTLGEVQAELSKGQEALNALSTDLHDLDVKVDKSMSEMDSRLTTAEDTLSQVRASLAQVSKSVKALDEQVKGFDTFFTSLRDLLIDMQGPPPPSPPVKAGQGVKRTPAPLPTPTLKGGSN